MNDEGIAAILGLVLLKHGGEVRLTEADIFNGLPEGHGIRVYTDDVTDELVVAVVPNE